MRAARTAAPSARWTSADGRGRSRFLARRGYEYEVAYEADPRCDERLRAA